jgi:hypothetical protein
MKKIVLLLIPMAVLIIACGEGLAPTDPESGDRTVFGGMIRFTPKDGWPPADSLNDLRVAAFKEFPPDDLLEAVLSGEAYFTQNSIEFYTDSAYYEIEVEDAPVNIEYIAVAQQYAGLYDWRVVGVYSSSADFSPESIFLEKGEKRLDIDINVDFTNLPPQPF